MALESVETVRVALRGVGIFGAIGAPNMHGNGAELTERAEVAFDGVIAVQAPCFVRLFSP
jgi:hypothetical protein